MQTEKGTAIKTVPFSCLFVKYDRIKLSQWADYISLQDNHMHMCHVLQYPYQAPVPFLRLSILNTFKHNLTDYWQKKPL